MGNSHEINDIFGFQKAAIDPVLQKQMEADQLLKKIKDPSRNEINKNLPHNDSSWWDNLSYDEQLAYLKAHRSSKFKLTKHPQSDEHLSLSGKKESLLRSPALYKNHKESQIKAIESTKFLKDDDGSIFAELKLGDHTVRLDPQDWKKAMKYKLRMERDPEYDKMILKGEHYQDRIKPDKSIDENEKYRTLSGILFNEGLKNPRMEYKNGNPYDLRRKNVIAKAYEKDIDKEIKKQNAQNIDFKRYTFDKDGLSVEIPGFSPSVNLDGEKQSLGAFPSVQEAMAAQDYAMKLESGEKSQDSILDDKEKEDIENLINFGNPKRADAFLRRIESIDDDERDVLEDSVRSFISKDPEGDWTHVRLLLDPKLPEGLTRTNLIESGISPRDLLNVDEQTKKDLFQSMLEERKEKETPQDEVIEEIEKEESSEHPSNWKKDETEDQYVSRVANELYVSEKENKKWSLKDRYDWFKGNKEIFGDYDRYMKFMNRMKILGDKLYHEDKGGQRGGTRKAIHIPILLYPSKMDFQDTAKHIYFFKKHKFQNEGSMDGSHHLWRMPGIYGRPTIDHHKGGYSPATGRSFASQAGFETVDPKENFNVKKHFDMLRKLGYSDAMDKIWNEYNNRKRLGFDTGEKVTERTASIIKEFLLYSLTK